MGFNKMLFQRLSRLLEKPMFRKAHGGDHCDPHGSHGPSIVIQKHTEFVLEDAPPLVELEKRLASRGLRDPWIRNEIWRFRESEFSTPKKRARLVFTRGILIGFISGGITAFIQKVYEKNVDEVHNCEK